VFLGYLIITTINCSIILFMMLHCLMCACCIIIKMVGGWMDGLYKSTQFFRMHHCYSFITTTTSSHRHLVYWGIH